MIRRFCIGFVFLLLLSGVAYGSVIPYFGDSGDIGESGNDFANGFDPIDTSDEGVFDFGALPDDGNGGGTGDGSTCSTAGCAEGTEPQEVDSSQEPEPERAFEDNGWAPVPDPEPIPADNKIKVDPTESTAEKVNQVVKEIETRNAEKVAEATGSNKPFMQRLIEGIKKTISDLNILKILTQSFKATLHQVANLLVSAGGILLGLPPGTSTLINLIIDDAVALNTAFPDGVPPTPVGELSLEAASAIAAAFGGVAHEEIGVNEAGEFQTDVRQIDIPEGTPTTKQVTIDGKVYTVTVSGDGTLVSVSSPPTSSGTSGVKVLQVGWDYGSFNSYPSAVCGDGVMYPVTEQCEATATTDVFDNTYCPQPTLCSTYGRLTAVRRQYGDCITNTCQCLYDTPTIEQWQYVPGSCGAVCNATIGCSGGQVCSNGLCGPVNLCGNGNIDISQGEQCDGTSILSCPAGTSCTSCQCVPTAPDCTNGMLETGEVCDVRIPAFLERQQGSNIGICRKPCESCQCTAGVSSYITSQQGVGPYEVGGIPVELCQGRDDQGALLPGRDDNCDGRVDETCVCTPGDTRICGERGSTCGAGGTQTCLPDSTWGICTVPYAPQTEIYDGIDNDCDFLVDECGIAGQNMTFFNEAVWEYNTSATTFMRITQTGVNTTVYFTAFTNFSAQVPLNFTLYETDCPGSALQISCSQEVQRRNVTTNAQGEGRDTFVINDSVFFQTRAQDGTNRTFFYIVEGFRQNMTRFRQNMTSTGLFVGQTSGSGPGDSGILLGNITGIYHGQVYLNGSALRINHTFSRNGNVQLNWTVGEDGFRTTADSFVHNFTTPGQKTLTLHVSNNQGGHAELQIGVLVVPSVGGDGLMTFIDYPGYYQIIPTGRNPSTTFVAGANTSFAVVRNATACGALQCVGGKCPSVTNNTDLVCGNTLRNISAAPQPYGALRFTWDYRHGNAWFSLPPGLVTQQFTFGESVYSQKLNDKHLRVTTNYTSGTTSLQSSFTRAYTLGQCLDNGYTFAVVTPHGRFVRFAATVSGVIQSPGAIFTNTSCRGEDGLNGTRDDCVPDGWVCGPNGGYRPTINATTLVFCDEYLEATSCRAARIAYPSSIVCGGTSQSASCVWDSAKNRCGTNYTVLDVRGAVDTCLEYINQTAPCTEGLRDVIIEARSTPASGATVCPAFNTACTTRADTLVCGRPAFELPFFGWWQLVIGGLGIVVLGFLRRKNARTFLKSFHH